jgi:penicillin-binding protein 2
MDRFQLSLDARSRIALFIVASVIIILLGGLIKLQILDHAKLSAQSENNRIRVVPIIPRRGHVVDRNGEVIIDNRPSYTISVVPAEEVEGVTMAGLAELTGLDTTVIRRRIQRNMVSRYQPTPVKRDVSFETVAVLEEQNYRFPGITYHMERVRRYADSLGSECFTGYVGEVSTDDLKGDQGADLRLGCMIGKKGLEKHYDYLLRGREGTAYIEVSASGQILGPYEDRSPIPAKPGTDLVLTIDNDIQREALHAIDSFCCGAVVAIDPRSGEILAMTSYPSYDANIFSSVIPESLWQEISNDSTHPLLNRPINGLYPPGSTTKLVTAGAALEEGLVTPGTLLKPCLGGIQFGNRWFGCWNPGGHGSLTLVHAIEQSCDVYLYQCGRMLTVKGLSDYIGRCGFGRVTNIDLPAEAAGLDPTPEYLNERYGKHGWTEGLALNIAIGQGEFLTTPLQLAQFYCGLADDGVVYQPHLVKKAISPSGEEMVVTPKVSFRLPFSEQTLTVLREGLKLVVEGEHGTARSLRNKYYTLGGKTGTAENPHGANHSWFVGFAPLENPEIVVCAIVENAGHGSEVAAPLVGSVIRAYMEKHGYMNEIASKDGGGSQ